MKKKSILFVFFAITFFLSCEKEIDKDCEPVKNSYRIGQAITYYNGIEKSKSVFTYEGERLTLVTHYEKNETGNWVEKAKREITYNGENAITTWYYKDSSNWNFEYKSEYVIENGQMMEELNFEYVNNQWDRDSKWIYHYYGNNLIAWQRYEDENGSFKQDNIGGYIYKNNKLIKYIEIIKDSSDNWNPIKNETFSYSGDNMTGWIGLKKDSLKNWRKSYKYDYSYCGNKISEAKFRNWNSETNDWNTDSYSETYNYNSNGYLIEMTNNENYRVVFEYNAGNGNAKFFWYYPEELIYSGPTLRSATAKKEYIPYYVRSRY